MFQKILKLILLTNFDLNYPIKASNPNSEKTGVRAYLTLWYVRLSEELIYEWKYTFFVILLLKLLTFKLNNSNFANLVLLG